MRLIGGERLDQRFLADLPVAPGMQIGLYSDSGIIGERSLGISAANPVAPVSAFAAFDPARLAGPNGGVPGAIHYQGLIDNARRTGQQASGIVDATGRREDSLNATAIPLKNEQGNVMAVLVVALSRSGMVAGAAAHPRHCLWCRGRRHSACHRIQSVDCGAGLAAH